MEKAEKRSGTGPTEAESQKEEAPVDDKALEHVSGGIQPGSRECYVDILGGLIHIGHDKD